MKHYYILIGVGFLFGIEVIIADIWFADYPVNMNISFPYSILFYPVIGFIVEVFFHLLPLSILIYLLLKFSRLNLDQVIWISIIAVSALEPIYQVWFANDNSLVTGIYTGIHVFLFSLTQLFIFKEFDFISMFLFRILFYMIWHITWGHIRLDVLF